MTVGVDVRRCERCNAIGLFTEWDDDIRRYVVKCALCGRVQGSAPAIARETEKVTDNGTETKKTDWRTRVPKTAEATPTVKPDGAAAKALESYHVATTRYLEASEQLRLDEQRAADAQARAKATAERLETFRATMAEARAKLDAELALLTPAGTPKPFSQRVKMRAAGNVGSASTRGAAWSAGRRSSRRCRRRSTARRSAAASGRRRYVGARSRPRSSPRRCPSWRRRRHDADGGQLVLGRRLHRQGARRRRDVSRLAVRG